MAIVLSVRVGKARPKKSIPFSRLFFHFVHSCIFCLKHKKDRSCFYSDHERMKATAKSANNKMALCSKNGQTQKNRHDKTNKKARKTRMNKAWHAGVDLDISFKGICSQKARNASATCKYQRG